MKKHSTGALTKEQRKQQDKLYAQHHKYDYVIIGTGNSALTAGALLANSGYKVCMLEAHDTPGGYVHTFSMGKFSFCAQVHYIWGCGSGGMIYEFLKKIGLHKDITFELYDPDGYDQMVMPDGNRIKFPYGFDRLVHNVSSVYGQKENVERFVRIVSQLGSEIRYLPMKYSDWGVGLLKHSMLRTIVKYRNKTLQNVFDECGLSKKIQTVLSANAGDFMSPPDELSIFAYAGLMCGYNTGAYYPTKHYKYYIGRIADFITNHKGCHIYYETEVSRINADKDRVVSVETKDGKKFVAKRFICNMDPQRAAQMIGWKKFPAAYRKRLSYKYSPSALMVYLGLKGIDLRKYGFGKHNTWHTEEWDANKVWKKMLSPMAEKRGIFISTPTLHSSKPGTAPKGCHIMEVATFMDYDYFKKAQQRSYGEYNRRKMAIAERVLDIVEKRYVPDLRKHIILKVVGTPTTNEDFVFAPMGNSYGAVLTPSNMGLKRLDAKTHWKNFFWCNATSGYPGVYGTARTGVRLYMNLTGDWFYDARKESTTFKNILL